MDADKVADFLERRFRAETERLERSLKAAADEAESLRRENRQLWLAAGRLLQIGSEVRGTVAVVAAIAVDADCVSGDVYDAISGAGSVWDEGVVKVNDLLDGIVPLAPIK